MVESYVDASTVEWEIALNGFKEVKATLQNVVRMIKESKEVYRDSFLNPILTPKDVFKAGKANKSKNS